MGKSVEELTAVLAAFAQKGIKGEMAGPEQCPGDDLRRARVELSALV